MRLVISRQLGIHLTSLPAPTRLRSHHGEVRVENVEVSIKRFLSWWQNCVSVWVVHNAAFLHMSTLPEQAFPLLCDQEGGLAVGSGSTSVFYHFSLFVPWLLSWAQQLLCAATFRDWTTLSRYKPGQNCREMGTHCGPGDSSPVPNSHAAKCCLCQGNVNFVLGFSVSNTWCGKWGGGAILSNPSFCFSIHLLWAQREPRKAGGSSHQLGSDPWVNRMVFGASVSDTEPSCLCQASCVWYLPWSSCSGLVENLCPTFLGLGCFFSIICLQFIKTSSPYAAEAEESNTELPIWGPHSFSFWKGSCALAMQAVEAKWIEGSQETGEDVFVLQHSAKGFPSDVVRTAGLGVADGDVVPNHFSRQNIFGWILAVSAFPFPWDVSQDWITAETCTVGLMQRIPREQGTFLSGQCSMCSLGWQSTAAVTLGKKLTA